MSAKLSTAKVKALVAAVREGGATIHRVTLFANPERIVIETQPVAPLTSGFDEVEFGNGAT